ncbi:SGNH/GDSL hydrolase family protein [Micropruina sp.]|uniref:SGNH/GDSL hydrolase family protein n=1 Tax=Micropruina sp. TaxID=2737536 RepID=UPI0039E3D91F
MPAGTAQAYPVQVAAANSLDLTHLACAGATMQSVAASQLPQVPTDTNFISVQVGGNDIGFASLLLTCTPAHSNKACAAAVRQARAYLNGDFRADATALFTAIRAQARYARLIVVGYPRLFGSRDCSPLTAFSARERAWLNNLTTRLNRRLRQAALAAGGSFANPANRFSAHPWCSRRPWINSPDNSLIASFHPNAAGQTNGYVPVMNQQFLA